VSESEIMRVNYIDAQKHTATNQYHHNFTFIWHPEGFFKNIFALHKGVLL
jgi:hypothetical protein